MITLDRKGFSPIEEDGFPENTELNQKVETTIQQINSKLAEINFPDFDITVKLSGQLYNSIEPFRFIKCKISPDFTPEEIHTQIEMILKTEFDSCLDHLR